MKKTILLNLVLISMAMNAQAMDISISRNVAIAKVLTHPSVDSLLNDHFISQITSMGSFELEGSGHVPAGTKGVEITLRVRSSQKDNVYADCFTKISARVILNNNNEPEVVIPHPSWISQSCG